MRKHTRTPEAGPLLDHVAEPRPEVIAREDTEVNEPGMRRHPHGLGGYDSTVRLTPVPEHVEEEHRVERSVPERQAPGVATDERIPGAAVERPAEAKRGHGPVKPDGGAAPGRERLERPAITAADLEDAGAVGQAREPGAAAVEPAAPAVVLVPGVIHEEVSAPEPVCVSSRRTGPCPYLSPAPSTSLCMEAQGASNRYAILAVVVAGVFMAVLDGVVVAVALPTITAHFGVNLDSTQWVITAYLLTMTVALLPMGRLSEYTGRAALFVGGITLFTVASAACGLAPTLAVLVAARVVQAIGGSMVFSISNALIFEAFPPAERGRALGYLGSAVAFSALSSPAVGGGLVEAFGWQAVFFINIPIGIAVVTAAFLVLPRAHARPDQFRFDLPGAVALGCAVASLVVFLGRLATSPVIDAPAAVLAVAFVAASVAFVLVERRSPAPLVDLELFAELLYVLPVAAMLLYFVAAFMMSLVSPFYFEGVMGFTPGTVGLVLLLQPAVMAVAAPSAGWLYDRTQSAYLAALGMGLVTAGYAVAGLAASAQQLVPMLGAFLIIGLGAGLFQAPNNTAQMSAVPRRWLGLASAITATGRNLGMSLGVSIGSVLLAVLLVAGGDPGPVLEAEPDVLAGSVGTIIGVGAVLTGLAAALSASRGYLVARAAQADEPAQP